MPNWFDLVILLIVAASALVGVRAGLARVIIGLIATVVGLVVGFWCYRIVAAQLMPWIHVVAVANVLGFVLIFVGILVVGSLLSALLSWLFKWIGLSWLNHFLGGVAGLLRGILVAAAIVDVVVAYAPSPTPRFLDNSQILPYASEVSAFLVNVAPSELKDSFTQQMQNLRHMWNADHLRSGWNAHRFSRGFSDGHERNTLALRLAAD